MDAPATPKKGMSKNTKIIIWVVVIVVIVVAAILTYLYWYKPNYIDNKTTNTNNNATDTPPTKKTIDVTDATLIKTLANTSDANQVARILKAA